MSESQLALVFRRPRGDERALERERLKERLLPRVLELAKARGREGFIAADVVSAAIANWGIFTGEEWHANPRAYSFIGPWLSYLSHQGIIAPKLIGGVHVRDKSTRPRSKANDALKYVCLEAS